MWKFYPLNYEHSRKKGILITYSIYSTYCIYEYNAYWEFFIRAGDLLKGQSSVLYLFTYPHTCTVHICTSIYLSNLWVACNFRFLCMMSQKPQWFKLQSRVLRDKLYTKFIYSFFAASETCNETCFPFI